MKWAPAPIPPKAARWPPPSSRTSRARGALIFATTHYDALKTWGTATDGVMTAAFAFDPHTFAPSYRLIYGAPGRSLAIEISQRLGLPASVVAAARNHLSDDRKRLDAHLERVDAQARALDTERRKLERERAGLVDQNQALRQRESAVAEREGRLAKRVNEKLDDRLRQARKDIDEVIAQLKEKSETLIEQASARAQRAAISTGEAGAVRGEAATAVNRIIEGLRQPAAGPATPPESSRPVAIGARVTVGGLGIRTPPITAQNVISTPTDKSMPEVMMMKVLAMASTPITVVDCKMPMMLSSVMKASGLRTLNTTISAIKLANAKSFCLA